MLTAASFMWLLMALLGCLLLGLSVAAVFGSIFYGASRVGRAAAARWDGEIGKGTTPN